MTKATSSPPKKYNSNNEKHKYMPVTYITVFLNCRLPKGNEQ